jgi:flagellar biosynthesis chaperone FliJ
VAFKLTKAEDARKSEYEAELETLVGGVEDARNELQEKIQALVEEFNEKHIQPLNDKLEEVRGFVEDIHSERQSDYDDKSEGWQEGDRGQNAYQWLSDWENGLNDLDGMEPLETPDVSVDVPDAANVLAGLPFEADQ